MRDFENAVALATQELIKSGALTKLVKEQVAKTLATIVADALGAYRSPFAKQLTEAVSASLSIDPSALGLAGYNKVVLAVVQQKLDEAVHVVGREQIAKDMAKLLGTDAPKQIKLSALLEQFKEFARENHERDRDQRRCTIILERRDQYSSRWLYLDVKPDKQKYDCRYRMLIGTDDGKVSACGIEGSDPSKTVFLGTIYGFARTLFQMYAAGTRVVFDLDTDDVEDYLGGDDD